MFFKVLLHTYIDSLRSENEETENENSECVGSFVKVLPAPPAETRGKKLLSVDEKVQQEAMKSFYNK